MSRTEALRSARESFTGGSVFDDTAELVIDCSEGSAPDTRMLRQALGRFATGVTVVTTRTSAGKLEGLTANSFSSVSLDPPLILWSLRRAAPSFSGFIEASWFAINVLGTHQTSLSRHFATASPDKFADLSWTEGLGGCPLLPDCLARFECRTETIVEAGDHNIFIGRVNRATHREGEALLFNAGRYCVPNILQA